MKREPQASSEALIDKPAPRNKRNLGRGQRRVSSGFMAVLAAERAEAYVELM